MRFPVHGVMLFSQSLCADCNGDHLILVKTGEEMGYLCVVTAWLVFWCSMERIGRQLWFISWCISFAVKMWCCAMLSFRQFEMIMLEVLPLSWPAYVFLVIVYLHVQWTYKPVKRCAYCGLIDPGTMTPAKCCTLVCRFLLPVFQFLYHFFITTPHFVITSVWIII